ncbi:DNA invertase Pin-like site-specific DNA recombinase [Curtobacterium sp. PhB130]|uniref:recombinase family protein n=1 Tax=Curtobacterium sp. PhB130 TaxID=2485178 RepID=UPI000F4B259A|nr:recombinase family protein [Curtobacterium sp. PhB130]ROS77939.1 DNA invertase Pin-like site-specific DNA recombinase [Curtobacterium sp. PhB130]
MVNAIKIGLTGDAESHALGYARVSSVKQSTENQKNLLTSAGCTEIFEDWAVSGAKNREAPGFIDLMARVKELRNAGHEVVVCVTKLDRFSRSLEDLLTSVRELGALGASFQAIDDGFIYDAGSPFSKLVLQMFGALAEFERSLIRSRMDEGRAVKVSKGLRLGKKPKLTQAAVTAIRAGYDSKKSPDELAKDWNVSKSLIGRVLGIYPSLPPYVTLDQWEADKVRANAKEVPHA